MLQELELEKQKKSLDEAQLEMLTHGECTEDFVALEKKADQFKLQLKKTETDLNFIYEKVLQLRQDEKIMEKNVEIEKMYSDLANSKNQCIVASKKCQGLGNGIESFENMKKEIHNRQAIEMELWQTVSREAELIREIKFKKELERLTQSADVWTMEAIAKIKGGHTLSDVDEFERRRQSFT